MSSPALASAGANAPPAVRAAPVASGAAHAASSADEHAIGGAAAFGNLVVQPQEELVGIAYAVGGGVRWFAHHAVFEIVRKKLVVGIAFDTLVVRAEAQAQHRPPPPSRRRPRPPSTRS